MANDMIVVFNQLTNQELADCTLFEKILDLHYEKFKYFYSIIEEMTLDKVQKINCGEQPSELDISIEFKNKKNRDEFQKSFESKLFIMKQSVYTKAFNLFIDKEGNRLNISIENKEISREEDIYEDRFDTD